MRACVIFNPTARGEKARRFREHLNEFARDCSLRLTSAPGDAERFAAEAAGLGFDTIVAAGGDGTVNEVLNGLASSPAGLANARLAVLPLGTVNVFARELGLPTRVGDAWNSILKGREIAIDLPKVEFQSGGTPRARYFAQMAGAGLDARAVELVHYPLKKKVGLLAYIYAGLQALTESPAKIQAEAGGQTAQGGLALIGNGRLYGGSYRVFPKADWQDGLLEVCVFPRVGWLTLAHCGPYLLLRGSVPSSATTMLRGETVTLRPAEQRPVPFEVDGEWTGHLPATFSIARRALRVVVPGRDPIAKR